MTASFRTLPTDDAAADLWLPDFGTLALWDLLQPGREVTIVKRSAIGNEAARYTGIVQADDTGMPWRTLLAEWTLPDVSQGDLTFTTGDILHERFSPRHPFNSFGVVSPDGTFKGWYANVTWPTFLHQEGSTLVLTWQDLLLDIVALPDGSIQSLDDDELAASAIVTATPSFARELRSVRDHMIELARTSQDPFRTSSPSS